MEAVTVSHRCGDEFTERRVRMNEAKDEVCQSLETQSSLNDGKTLLRAILQWFNFCFHQDEP